MSETEVSDVEDTRYVKGIEDRSVARTVNLESLIEFEEAGASFLIEHVLVVW